MNALLFQSAKPNGKVFFILDGGAGEIARHEATEIEGDGDYVAGMYTRQLIEWLERDHIVLTEGDTIKIVWQEN